MTGSSSVVLRRIALTGVASFALVASLAVAEAALRAFGLGPPPLFKLDARLRDQAAVAVPDVDLIYRLEPGSTLLDKYRLNALGYRGPEVGRERGRNVLRVICTGDSSTFGLGVEEEEAWPFVLGRLLRAELAERGDPRRVEVIDAAVPGYTTLQNRAQIVRDLLPLAPDAIVWCPMGHNDAARITPPDELGRWSARRGLVGWLRGLALVHRIGVLIAAAPGDGAAVKVPRVSLDQLEDNLHAASVATRNQGVLLVLVAPPHDARARLDRPDEMAAEERVVEFARRTGVALGDPRSDIDAIAARDPFPDGVHPSAEAHALIARRAFEALLAASPDLVVR